MTHTNMVARAYSTKFYIYLSTSKDKGREWSRWQLDFMLFEMVSQPDYGLEWARARVVCVCALNKAIA